LTQAVDRAASDPSVGLARALKEAGAADESVLTSLMAEQAVDAVFDLLRWPEGDFGFGVDEGNPDDLGIQLPVDDVVSEARRRLEYWQTVSRTIPSPDSVLVIAAHAPADLSINADEWSMLGLVDGRRGVHELIALTGRGEFTCVSALAAMVDRGLLTVRGVDDHSSQDAATALIRRHTVLARLETGVPVSSPSLAAAVSGQAPEQTVAQAPEQTIAQAQQVPHASMLSPTSPGLTAARPEDRNVTPARPEPFLPRRTPDHPEDHVPASTMSSMSSTAPMSSGVGPVVGSTAVAAAVAPAASPYIERDPSVNKSLLLRLIAGVRGL
jgi:hypothetical protein